MGSVAKIIFWFLEQRCILQAMRTGVRKWERRRVAYRPVGSPSWLRGSAWLLWPAGARWRRVAAARVTRNKFTWLSVITSESYAGRNISLQT